MRKTIKHAVYTIEEKNQIVAKYSNQELGMNAIVLKYDIADKSVLRLWIKQVKQFGTCVDGRGRSSNGKLGRPKKIKPEDMTREELIKVVRVLQDIKKSIAYLRQQKTSIK